MSHRKFSDAIEKSRAMLHSNLTTICKKGTLHGSLCSYADMQMVSIVSLTLGLVLLQFVESIVENWKKDDMTGLVKSSK